MQSRGRLVSPATPSGVRSDPRRNSKGTRDPQALPATHRLAAQAPRRRPTRSSGASTLNPRPADNSRSPTYCRVPRHFLKMLSGSLALTGYRPLNEQLSPSLNSRHAQPTLTRPADEPIPRRLGENRQTPDDRHDHRHRSSGYQDWYLPRSRRSRISS